ncbi:hypothetical protein [Streptomyces sp. NPDC058739]|uniref:hypothetical protein n=1 Tax=Streptomyces sp. NPDC058739 TaxID=3346618 RepID=UPI0036A56737
MQTFVTVVVILALIAFAVLLIHLLNSQHSERIPDFHYGRSGMPVPGPDPSAPRKAHGRAGAGRHRTPPRPREDGPSRPTTPSRPN